MKVHHSIPIITTLLLYACSPVNPAPPTALQSQPAQTLSSPTPPLTPSASQPQLDQRDLLTFNDLFNGFDPDSPVNDAAFAMPADAESTEYTFEGRLELHGEDQVGNILVHRGDPDVEPEIPHLPQFDFEFVQSGSDFIPTKRGLIITDHPIWNYIIEPGQVWQEPGDGDYSRVSFPFALVWKGSNAIFNGVMSFLFNEAGISKVWYQTTQETTISMSADFWGLLDATYHHAPVVGADQIRESFAQEKAARFPTKPITQLAVEYPGIDIFQFGRGISPSHLTYYGFVINGVNYVSECPTRYGQYAYCEHLRAPSYSTAKSIFPSLALMRLAQKYGPQVASTLIKDYLPEYVDSPGDWSSVTFDHTLDMATGNYGSAGYMQDEENFDRDPFWIEEYYAERIAAALNWPNSAAPGTQWVYRTFDTFIVTRALHNYLQTMEGSDADIFQFLVDEVFIPIDVGPGAHSTLRTKDDNWQGQPYGGYGLWWVPDDIAKITTFINVARGAAGGEQILHPDLLAAALQADPDDRGVDIDSSSKYNNAFWARKYSPRDGFDCEFWVPQMLGYSGIVIILMPNGSTYYYASDNREFNWLEAIRESNKIAPHCQPASTGSNPSPGSLGDTYLRPLDEMDMVYVPGGEFQMGSPATDPDANEGEFPQHRVTLDGFWIDSTEVTNAQYTNCIDGGSCQESRYAKTPTYNGPDYPIVGISWQNAADYCAWAGGRLPTEAEWEYAARGEQGFRYPWGDRFDGNLVNFCDLNCGETWADDEIDDGFAENAPVATYPAGASWTGAFDLAGNVWEWVEDWYTDYTTEAQTNPHGPPSGDYKIIRGGCYANGADGVRSAYRFAGGGDISPTFRHPNIGFRCVLSGPEV